MSPVVIKSMIKGLVRRPQPPRGGRRRSSSGCCRRSPTFVRRRRRVPFRILTKDEEKFVNKNYGDIRKQAQNAFKEKSN